MRGQRAARIFSLTIALLGCGARDTPESAPEPTVHVEPGRETRQPPRTIDLAPPEDRTLSPYTGWTRAHYEAVFGRVLLGFVDHRSATGARTRYPGGEQLPAAMEGAIRMLPALGAWLACPCNPDRVIIEARELDVAAIARAIVVGGTDPRSPDYWHPIGKAWDQRKVEAATLAVFLVRARARVWDRLTSLEQAMVMAWLREADEPLAANWLAFQIARNTARKAFDRPIDEAALARQLELLEADYEGDGFYRDGGHDRFDWYNAFVIHPGLTFWRAAVEHESAAEQARAARVAARTRTFVRELPYLMDADGGIPPIGRSLAYRSAVLAALQTSILAGDEFVAPGLARRMSSASLRQHVEAGMFADDHTLTRGYHGEQPRVLERYVRPGSQYYFTRALAVLALPPSHGFWTEVERPLPADEGDFVHAVPAIGWMVEHDREGGGLVLHNARSSMSKDAYHERYKKLSYAPRYWFAAETDDRRPYDAMIVSAARGRFDRRRWGPKSWAVAPGFAWVRYATAPEAAAGVGPHWISTAVLTGGLDDARPEPSVRLTCVYPSRRTPALPLEGSVALASRGVSETRASEELDGGPVWAYVATPRHQPGGGAVLLAGLAGWTRAGERLDWDGPAAHVLGGEATWVGLSVDAAFADSRCFASMQQLDDAPFDPARALAGAPAVELLGSRATVAYADGARAWVELSAELLERTIELGPLRLSGPLRMARTYERDGVRILVAVGLRSLAGASSEKLLIAAEPRTLRCELGDRRLRCELDGPIAARPPDDGPLTLRWRAPGWTGGAPEWTDAELEYGSTGWVRIELPESESSTMIFELAPGDATGEQ